MGVFVKTNVIIGGVHASVTKSYKGVKGSQKASKNNVTYYMDGPLRCAPNRKKNEHLIVFYFIHSSHIKEILRKVKKYCCTQSLDGSAGRPIPAAPTRLL